MAANTRPQPKCPKCSAVGEDSTDRFCRRCGELLSPVAIDTVAWDHIKMELREEVRAIIAQQYGDRDVVETDLAHKVLGRLWGWGKAVIPLIVVLGGAYLAALGFTATSASSAASAAKEEARALLADVRERRAQIEGELLQARIEADGVAAKSKEQISQIQAMLEKGEADVRRALAPMEARTQGLEADMVAVSRMAKAAEGTAQAALDAALERNATRPDPATEPVVQQIGGFRAYLTSVGLTVPERAPDVRLLPPPNRTVLFDWQRNRFIIGQLAAKDEDIVLADYAECALSALEPYPLSSSLDEQDAARHGLAIYLVCSYSEDKQFGEKSAGANADDARRQWTCLVDLGDPTPFPAVEAGRGVEEIGATWAALFWTLRGACGKAKTDAFLVSTWRTYGGAKTSRDPKVALVAELLRVAAQPGSGVDTATVRSAIVARGLTHAVLGTAGPAK